jgi:hypothetical protein
MKKLIVIGAISLLVGNVLSEVAQNEVLPVPLSKMAEFNAKTGGLVYPPADARKCVIIDARVKDTHLIDNFVKYAEQRLSLDCEVRVQKLKEADIPSTIALECKKAGAGAVVLLCERQDIPVLTVFPEDAVTVLNLQPLWDKDDNAYRRRMSKEFWRAIGFAIGAYGTPTQVGSALQPVFSVMDLDAVKGIALSPPQIAVLLQSRIKLKIYGKRPIPYNRACREGWAPAPTNDVQRMFYNRMSDPASRFKSDIQIGNQSSESPSKK